MDEDTQALVFAAVGLVRECTLESFQAVNSCIETSRLLSLVLDRLEVKNRPQAVSVLVLNREAYFMVNERVPMADWPDEAWSLSISAESEGPGWSGHLVVILPLPGGRYLIDPSADQFHREGKLNVPGPVMMGIDGPWTPKDPLFRVLQDDRTILEYRPLVGDRAKVWPTTPAWNNNPDWFNAAADHIVELVRERVGSA